MPGFVASMTTRNLLVMSGAVAGSEATADEPLLKTSDGRDRPAP